MTPLEFGVVLSLGLASGLHCVQMCGPIVLTYSLSTPKGGALRAHFLYNSGRILTYALLGALAGAAGGGIGMLGRMAGLASGARIVSGAAMIVAGVLMIGLVGLAISCLASLFPAAKAASLETCEALRYE